MRWKVCPVNRRYAVSDSGSVRNKKTRRVVQTYDNGRGYLRVRLYHAYGPARWYPVHLLVLRTWDCERPGPEFEGAHHNGDRQDNRLANLFWKTKEQNTADRVRHYEERKCT